MIKQLKANLAANLIFYRRNRLVALIVIFFFFVWAMSFFPSLLFRSGSSRFDIVRETVVSLQWFINILVAALGLLTINYNLSRRCLKMVITKPCPPEVWLAGNLLTVCLISAALHVLSLAITITLFWVWHIPFQWGILYVAADGFLRSIIIFSVIAFLASVIHPFIAVLVMLVFSEGLFYWFVLLASAGLKTLAGQTPNTLLVIGKWLAYGFYLLMPIYSPYSRETTKLYASLHLDSSYLCYLGATFVYAVVLGTLFFLLTDLTLRRKCLT